MRNARHCVRGSAGLGLAVLTMLLAGPSAQAQQANYTLPQQPTAKSGNINYYSVPIGYTWDHFGYQNGNHGDWNVGLGDSGFDAGEIPTNPQNCGVRGASCPATAGAVGPAFVHTNNDPTHGFANIPMLIGPTQDGFNNVQIARGQVIPVVPGRYSALYLANTQINGPRRKMLALNYADSTQVRSITWADWCAPGQSPPDFFTWAPTHRLNAATNATPTNGASCALITKYVPVDPNRVLTSITLGTDSPDDQGGIALPGQTITGANGRTVIGSVTLASTDPNLGGYGFVSGKVVNAAGAAQTTPEHASAADTGYDVFVLDPPLGNYGAGANVDGSFTIGLPAGTYVLSVARRGGADDAASPGPQGTPVTVTVTAGQTSVQNITLLDNPTPNLWGELTGTVTDASGNPVEGASILLSNSQSGPFAAVAIAQDRDTGIGLTAADGTFAIQGLYTGKPVFVMASGNGFASAAPVQVTLTPGGTTSQDIAVVARPVGSIRGTIVAPGGSFGGIYVPVTLSSRDLTLTTTSRADPTLSATNRVPDDGSVTAVFEFESLPAGEYTLTLPASSVQGAAASVPVTITAGQTVTPTLTLAFPAWNEGTPDATKSDALTGTALDARWTAADIGTLSTPGTKQPSANGLAVTSDGAGWDTGAETGDAFRFIHQSVPAGDFVAYVTVTTAPETGMAGLMVSSANQATPERRANFAVSLRTDAGIDAQGRVADGNVTFPFGQTAVGTDPASGGTQPAMPVILKLRKVGSAISGFVSADGGKTQQFVGNLTPQFDPTANLLLGLATASGADGSPATATYRDFVFAPLASAQPATNPAAGQ